LKCTDDQNLASHLESFTTLNLPENEASKIKFLKRTIKMIFPVQKFHPKRGTAS